MYMDRFLEFERVGKDAPAVTTRALPMGQSDLVPLPGLDPATGTTADVSPDSGLYFMAVAGPNDVAAGMTFELQHADKQAGPFAPVQKFGPAAAAKPGEILVKAPCPQGLKNWVRVVKSASTPLNLCFTYNVAPKGLPTFPV